MNFCNNTALEEDRGSYAGQSKLLPQLEFYSNQLGFSSLKINTNLLILH